MVAKEEAHCQGYSTGVEELQKKISKATNEDKHLEKKGEGPRVHCGLPLGFVVCF